MLKNYFTYFTTMMGSKFGSKKGQGMVEYGLILVLIALVVIVAVSGVGKELVTQFGKITSGLQNATTAS